MKTIDLFELRQEAYQPCLHQDPGGQSSFATCPYCAAEAKGPGGDRVAWSRARATALLDEQVPKRYADAVADHREVLDWIARFVEKPAAAESLLIVGPTGVGKTYQAYGALRAAVTLAGVSWECVTYADFTAALRPNAKDPDKALKTFRGADLLLLDDLGTAKHSEWVEEITYRLLNGRYESMKPSIFTTNVPSGQLREALGDRIASRLGETCQRVVLKGEDRRRPRKVDS